MTQHELHTLDQCCGSGSGRLRSLLVIGSEFLKFDRSRGKKTGPDETITKFHNFKSYFFNHKNFINFKKILKCIKYKKNTGHFSDLESGSGLSSQVGSGFVFCGFWSVEVNSGTLQD